MQNGPLLREVDFVSPKHGVDPLSQLALLGQPNQQLYGFIRNAILRVIEKKANRLNGQAFAALWIVRKELSQVCFSNLFVVRSEILPCLALGSWAPGNRFCACRHMLLSFRVFRLFRTNSMAPKHVFEAQRDMSRSTTIRPSLYPGAITATALAEIGSPGPILFTWVGLGIRSAEPTASRRLMRRTY